MLTLKSRVQIMVWKERDGDKTFKFQWFLRNYLEGTWKLDAALESSFPIINENTVMTCKALSNYMHSSTRRTHDDILFQKRLERAMESVDGLIIVPLRFKKMPLDEIDKVIQERTL